MKSGTILRAYNYLKEEEITCKEQDKSLIIKTEINDIISEARNNIDRLITQSSDSLQEKIFNVDMHSEDLNVKFSNEVNNLKTLIESEINKMKDEYEEIIKEQKKSFNNHIQSLEIQTKEILIDLFRQFFFKEYEDTSNLDSIIHECLSQLEGSNNIKVTMQTNLFEQFKEKHQDTINKMLENNVHFSYHNKENLILEFKTECDCIEVDLNKQIDSLKELLLES